MSLTAIIIYSVFLAILVWGFTAYKLLQNYDLQFREMSSRYAERMEELCRIIDRLQARLSDKTHSAAHFSHMFHNVTAANIAQAEIIEKAEAEIAGLKKQLAKCSYYNDSQERRLKILRARIRRLTPHSAKAKTGRSHVKSEQVAMHSKGE